MREPSAAFRPVSSDARGGSDVRATSVLIDRGAALSTDALSAGDAGRLMIRADDVEIRVVDPSAAAAAASGRASSGATAATSRPLIAGVRSLVAANATGDAGAVTVEAGRLRVIGLGAIV